MTKKKPEITDAPKADRKTANIIAKWKAKYLALKPLEAEVRALKDQVTAAVVAAGSNCLLSPAGPVGIQTKTTTDWESLARALLDESAIESNIQKFTSVSAPFAMAPREWSKEHAEAKSARAAA